MNQIVDYLIYAGPPVQLAVAAAVLALCLLLAICVALLRGGRARAGDAAALAERQREMDDKMAELARLNSELTLWACAWVRGWSTARAPPPIIWPNWASGWR